MRAPSTILISPFVLGTGLMLYTAWENDGKFAIWIAPFFIIAAMIYVMSPQIDWWWYSQHPPKIDEPLLALLRRYSVVYQQLSETEKQFVEARTGLIMLDKNYMPMGGMESVTSDVELWVSFHLAVLTLKKKNDFHITPFENIVVYPRLFPSPQHPNDFHASEIFEEDGVVMVGIEPMVNGITQANKFYNVILHEWLKVYMLHFKPDFETLNTATWEQLTQISGFSKAHIEQCIGLPDVEQSLVVLHHFFVFRAPFKAQLPALNAMLEAHFFEL